MAMFSMGIAFALGLAPTLGGIVTDYLGWRYIFLIPVPLGFISLIMGVFFIPEKKIRGKRGSLTS